MKINILIIIISICILLASIFGIVNNNLCVLKIQAVLLGLLGIKDIVIQTLTIINKRNEK